MRERKREKKGITRVQKRASTLYFCFCRLKCEDGKYGLRNMVASPRTCINEEVKGTRRKWGGQEYVRMVIHGIAMGFLSITSRARVFVNELLRYRGFLCRYGGV